MVSAFLNLKISITFPRKKKDERKRNHDKYRVTDFFFSRLKEKNGGGKWGGEEQQ